MIYYQNKKSYNQLFSENYKDFIKDSLVYKYKLLNYLKTFDISTKYLVINKIDNHIEIKSIYFRLMT